ncbi:MAG TPA: 5-oxoprolinase subunit PxpB [Candidatus Dormibacteraeota bacterium]|nr:5-oxoprolinase subunit PxpB [Candidatus Dormibacteraeota bacterium]
MGWSEVRVDEGTEALPWRRVLPVGDAAMLIEFGEAIEVAINERVHVAARAVQELIAQGELPGVWGVIPSYATLLLEFDPLITPRNGIVDRLARRLRASAGGPPPARRFRIPVWYDGEDLAGVATRTGLSRDEVVAAHTSTDYRIFTVGFSPGQPLCGILPEALRLPRRGTPRAAVAAGSVAIAGRQVTIYPTATPGGWHLLGKTPVVAFRPERTPPVLWAPGDALRFYEIDRARYDELAAAAAAGAELLSAEAVSEEAPA